MAKVCVCVPATSNMPNRCFVPNCRSGYPDYSKALGKFTMFCVPGEEELLKRWNQVIPRKDTKLKRTSKVCSYHFEEHDVVKGRWIEGKEGKQIFFPWNNWVLKEGAIPRIFPKYPIYLSKPKAACKRKLPTERNLIPAKRRKNNSNLEDENIDDLPENWEGVEVDHDSLMQEQDPWDLSNPRTCKIPPSWYWIESHDQLSVALCVQF